MPRPYFQTGIAALETLFDRHGSDMAVLEALADELSYRSTDRAAALRQRVAGAMDRFELVTPGAAVRAGGFSRPDQAPEPFPSTERSSQDHQKASTDLGPLPPITNRATEVLSAWTALEVLSPPTFNKPADLAAGDLRAVARLDRPLPWDGKGEKARPGTKLFYQVVLGTIDMAGAADRLAATFADKRVERPGARGEAILATLILDREGRPLTEDGVMISSFGWGVPLALAGDLQGLARWPEVAEQLTAALEKRVTSPGEDERPCPLDRQAIDNAYAWLVGELGLPSDLMRPPSFAIRSFTSFRSFEPPAGLLLNSFFLGDLAKAKEMFKAGDAPEALSRFLGVVPPAARHELLTDTAALARTVEPRRFPIAGWPAPGRHPLVLLQQAAVNLALNRTDAPGILAVNGPPGTGKTTLLRDVLASLVTERARRMRDFRDPGEALVSSGMKIKAGAGWLHLYKLDPALRGFEMVVASYNNAAVENVSEGLPATDAVAADEPGLRYFKSLSDKLLERDSWGLGAAVLGKSANRAKFVQTFWWDKEVGLSTYLAAAAGTPQVIEEPTEGGAAPMTRPPLIVTAEGAPKSREEALERWRVACARFDDAVERSEAILADLEAVRVRSLHLPGLVSALAAWEQHATFSPGFWAWLFQSAAHRDWRTRNAALRAELGRRTADADEAGALTTDLAVSLRRLPGRARAGDGNATRLGHELDAEHAEVQRRRAEIGIRLVDEAFFDLAHEDRHMSAPWLDTAAHRARHDVFVAAMQLHKAFIDATAKPLRNNLGALMNVMGGSSLGSAEKDALISDLWSSLFLVVPAISTTFASVERMLGRLPPESLGWLLVDEAGQAPPQAVVGALMRSQRAVVVGDPVQIPPVVVLPETLTATIQRRFGVDPDLFNAPGASVQTLADGATGFMAEFPTRVGSRTVGVPLLVHRRCAEPMFGISNSVAYAGLMVQAKSPGPSRVRDVLGPSRWIDVEGAASDKWSAAEGEVLLDLLRRLAAEDVNPDLYVVTPFVVVADNLRRLIRDSGVLQGWTENPQAWVYERVGTVHTVQGREAEAVIFVLGAPLPSQSGARRWAGGQPNLLNVAVTRAKEVLYVIGARDPWREAGVFRELSERIA